MPTAEDNDYTLLVLSEIGVPLYSARGLTQTLTPIDAAKNQRRSINGELIDLSYDQFQKYSSKISCSDQRAPAIDGVWPGMEVTVACVCELAYPGSGGSPQREAVSGSSYSEHGFTFYRPILSMRVSEVEIQHDEYGAVVGWSMGLEEI